MGENDMVEKMDRDQMRAMQAAQKRAKENGEEPKRSGWLPKAGRGVKNTVVHPIDSGKKAGGWLKKKFWTGDGTQNEPGKARMKNEEEKLNAQLGIKEGEGQAQVTAPPNAPQAESHVVEDGNAYNEFRLSMIDDLERGYSRINDEELSNYMHHFVRDENLIEDIYNSRIPTPAELYDEQYSDQMIEVRRRLAGKLQTGQIRDLTFQELDVLIVTMLHHQDEDGDHPYRDLFFEYVQNLAKSKRTNEGTGAFIGSLVSRLGNTPSTSEDVMEQIGGGKNLPPILNEEIANEYFAEKSYGIIEDAVKEFKDNLPEDMHPFKKHGYVAAFRQTLLSGTDVIKEPDRFVENMPDEYKRVQEENKEVKELLSDIAKLADKMMRYKGSKVVGSDIRVRCVEVGKKYESISADHATKDKIGEVLFMLGAAYEEKFNLIKSNDYQEAVKSLIKQGEEADKARNEILPQIQVQLTNINEDFEFIRERLGEVESNLSDVKKKVRTGDPVLMKAREIIEKMKETQTEDGITKDQFIIANIVYEGGMKDIEAIAKRGQGATVKGPGFIDKLFFQGFWVLPPLGSWLVGKNITEPEEDRTSSVKKYTALQKVKFVSGALFDKINQKLKTPWLKKLKTSEGGTVKKALKISAYYLVNTIRNTLDAAFIPARIIKYWLWDSNPKGEWHKTLIGFGFAKKVYDNIAESEKYVDKPDTKGRKQLAARRGYIGALWAVVGGAAITTALSLITIFPLGTLPWGAGDWFKKNKFFEIWRGQLKRQLWTIESPFKREWVYPNLKSNPLSSGGWTIANERQSETSRNYVKKPIAGDATTDKKFMLQLYYSGVKRENLDEKEKEYKKQLEWLKDNPDVAKFFAERTFLKRMGYERHTVSEREAEKVKKHQELGYRLEGTTRGATKKHKFLIPAFNAGIIRDELKINKNKTAEFVGMLMAREEAGEFVERKVNRKLNVLAKENGTYQKMIEKHGEGQILSSIDGHLMKIIEGALLGKEDSVKELGNYGIVINEKGKLKLEDKELLRTAVMENVVRKIKKYGIESFASEREFTKTDISYGYLESNLKKWSDEGYLVPKMMLAYMNTYGVTSIRNAELLIANPEIGMWLGPKTDRGKAPVYIPQESKDENGKTVHNVEEVVDILYDEIEKETGKSKGLIAIMPPSRKMEILRNTLKKAEKKELVVDVQDEYERYLDETRLKEELQRYYPHRTELIGYIIANEVKADWFDYLAGNETERDESEIKQEIIDYLENQKEYFATVRAERIDEDIKDLTKKIKDLEIDKDFADENRELELEAEIASLEKEIDELKRERDDPARYLDELISYLKEGKSLPAEGQLIVEGYEPGPDNSTVIKYLENARKEKDIKHMLMSYRSGDAKMSILPNMLDDFIVEVMEHIENGGRAHDFHAVEGSMLHYAKNKGYLWPLVTDVSSIMATEEGGKVGVRSEAIAKSEILIGQLDNVLPHLEGKQEYDKAVERHGLDLVKSEIRVFIYMKMDNALEDKAVVNELLANGIKFDEDGNARLQNSEKLAEYIYENKIVGLSIAVNVSDATREASAEVLNVVEGMMSGMASDRKTPYAKMSKEYGDERVMEVIDAYLLKQIALAKSGETAVADLLRQNGIEFDSDGNAVLNENADKLGDFITKYVLNKMKKQGIEYFDTYVNEIKPVPVAPGEPVSEGTMETPGEKSEEKEEETPESKYGTVMVFDSVINSGDYEAYKDKYENVTVVFDTGDVSQIGKVRPGDAVKKAEEEGYEQIDRDVKLVEKNGQAYFQLSAIDTGGLLGKSKKVILDYHIGTGKLKQVKEE